MEALTLLCLPYAGGSSSVFREWEHLTPPWIRVRSVDLPGHGMRSAEKSISQWGPLLDWLIAELPNLQAPFAIFGHSMGALVGIELAHALRERRQLNPVWLGAAGCTAPSRRERELKWLVCPETEILDELRELGGTPPELFESRELLDLVLPTLRSDFHLCGSYVRRDRPPLDCPILVLGGTTDADVSEPIENLVCWREETRAPCTVDMIEDGHFFLERSRDQVLAKIVKSLGMTLRLRGMADA